MRGKRREGEGEGGGRIEAMALASVCIHTYIHTYTRACVPRTLFPMIFFRPPPVCVPRVFVLFPSLFFSLNFLVAMRTVAMQENDVSSSTRVRGCLPVVFKSTLGTQQLQLKKKKESLYARRCSLAFLTLAI